MILKFAIQDFKEDREYKNISQNTIKAYLLTLNEFQKFCAEKEIINVTEVTPQVIKSYVVYLQKERGNNPTTRNTKLRNIKAFFNYLVESEIIEKNPAKKIAMAKTDLKIEVFQDHHIKKMLGYCRRNKQRWQSFHAVRDYMIIVFLIGSGVRVGELVNIQWKDIDLINNVITVFGKKRQQSSIPVTDKLKKELCEYKIYCQQYFKDQELDFVFVDKQNKQMSVNSAKCMFKELKNVMDFKDVRLSAHTFRHTFAHKMLMAGADVFTLQKMLRHTDLKQTMVYVSLWGTALKEQNDKFNPLNTLDI